MCGIPVPAAFEGDILDALIPLRPSIESSKFMWVKELLSPPPPPGPPPGPGPFPPVNLLTRELIVFVSFSVIDVIFFYNYAL
jgi:hypothetical protein